MRIRNIDLYALAGFLVLCLTVDLIGGLVTSSSVKDWYPALQKPSWTPPAWLFGPVWALLYSLMAFSAWLIYLSAHGSKRFKALLVFGLQLFFNLSWSFLFFGLKSPGWAFIDIFILWFALWAAVIVFYRIKPLAAYLLAPYLLWVSFSMILNAAIFYLNN